MKTNKVEVNKLDIFSTPIFVCDLEEELVNRIQGEIDKVFPDILRNENFENPWDDTVYSSFSYENEKNDKFLLQKYNLKNLIFIIQTTAESILESYDYPIEKVRFGESWFNISMKKGFQFEHNHSDCLLSGVYYYRTNENDGDIVFLNPNPAKHFNNLFFPYNDSLFSFKPKIGRMIIFPGWLNHKVLPNNTDDERISITFNIKNH